MESTLTAGNPCLNPFSNNTKIFDENYFLFNYLHNNVFTVVQQLANISYYYYWQLLLVYKDPNLPSKYNKQKNSHFETVFRQPTNIINRVYYFLVFLLLLICNLDILWFTNLIHKNKNTQMHGVRLQEPLTI